MEGNNAATYALIYRFLKRQSQNKAAEAVKKAAKPFVVLRDDIEQEGTPLEDIIKEWKTRKSTNSGDVDSPSEDSESSDGSSSQSEDGSSGGSSSGDTSGEDDDTSGSDESSDDSDEGTEPKKLPPKSAAERDTSATLSSGENIREATKQVFQILTKDESEGSESDRSDSDDPSESSDSDSSDAETTSNSSDPSSSSDSSDEDEANANEKAPQNRTTTTDDKSSSSSGSSSESEDELGPESQQEDAPVAKKRRTSESGAAVTTAVTTESERIARPSQRKERSPPKVKERFQRVKVQNLTPEHLLDNGYQARGGASNDYGERAHRDLVVTRGAGFRKEKNKKKRGSYRGGEITMENHSIKFDF